MSQRVYLDYAATAPLRPEVLAAMLPYLGERFGNPNALYAEGQQARRALDQARADLAAALGASPLDLTFCSGGTEAAGALINGIARGAAQSQPRRKHLVCAAFEHHAVLDNCQALGKQGYTVDLLRPRRDGRIHPSDLAAAMRADTLLVVVMWAQNELGTVQPLADLAAVAHERGAYFISDAVQALGKIPVDLNASGLDAAAFSAHKIGGPKGVGLFYLRRGTPFAPVQLGGGQENKRRSGTQDVAGAVGFAAAARCLAPQTLLAEARRLATLRDELLQELLSLSPRISSTVNIHPGDIYTHLPGLLHLLVQGIESQTMVLRLDEAGIAVGGGAACSSGSLRPSHVLTALGVRPQLAHGALRVSLGADSQPEHCQRLLAALRPALRA